MMWSVDAKVGTSKSEDLHCIYTHTIKTDQQCSDRSECMVEPFNVEIDSDAELGKQSLVTITVESAISPTHRRASILGELTVCTRFPFKATLYYVNVPNR